MNQSATEAQAGYGPSHPWHYLADGDNATPIAADAIPLQPLEHVAAEMTRALPKNVDKRRAALDAMLETERQRLAERIQRYEDVRTHGIAALSRYDRTIAYQDREEMAVACSLALLYRQIASYQARVGWLEREQAKEPRLFD